MTISFEQREGRMTDHEYRAVVVMGTQRAEGPWCFTKRDARMHVAELRRAILNSDAHQATLAGESARRMRAARVAIDHDRTVKLA